jgi:hypothetical protein
MISTTMHPAQRAGALDAGDLVAATYLIRRLLAFATFAAACADDLEVMGAGQ